MNETLGVDLGTNSIGLTLREDDEFKWYGVYTFKKGVGEVKGKEFSLAAERTKHRSSRRLYNARRYRRWETFKVLIENDCCPLTMEKLNRWKHYTKGIGRTYPVDDKEFQKWIALDFNDDESADYSSPYQLRRLLISEKLNLNDKVSRYKIGRAFYHIAQRRGFKSSRKVGKNEKTAVYEGSSKTKTIGRNSYEQLLDEHGSLGAASAYLEDEGIRVRNRYTLRSDYLKEVKKICELQCIPEDFSSKIVKAIFFQRPLRSQKGLVGKCTMEPNKPRCPVSHPLFEEYRAWSFVNNIKYHQNNEEEFRPLPLALRQELIAEKFLIKSRKTNFLKIRKFINKGNRKHWELNYSHRMDKMTVSTCPVSAYLKAAFGDDWKNVKISTNRIRTKKNGEFHYISYSIDDIWHMAFNFEDEEFYQEFLIKKVGLEDGQVDQLLKLWNILPVGYANLSLKAIRNILPFLREGIIYSEAVFLAKIPDVIGAEKFKENRDSIIKELNIQIKENREKITIVNITNALIADYKALSWEDKFAYKNTEYVLEESDDHDIKGACSKHYGKNRWGRKNQHEQDEIIENVNQIYQEFFKTSKRDYLSQPRLMDQISEFLLSNFDVHEIELEQLYHPSMIDIYPSTEDQELLKTSRTRAFKNPMAYKTLHKLRHVINHLIKKGLIDSDTRIVVEVARDLNNKNKRAAIEDYQRNRERENIEFAGAISELIKDPDFEGQANPASKKDREKMRLWTDQLPNKDDIISEILATKDDVRKFRLWKEQTCICFYTGKPIGITDLFNDNVIDFEHTIPRSKSFDNSLANLTVCYADYNRNIKGNKLPTQLPNYSEKSKGYSAIKPRLQEWEDKIESLYNQIQTQVKNSKFAMDKEAKDAAIRKRHLLQMEYNYWKNKVDRFTREDVPTGFRNSQLIDTQIISKYAYHYLKTVFSQVETIRGNVTAEFRKIYEIQPKGDEKDRSKHYHHAIDAAVLTLLPTSAKRKEILEKSYKYAEQNYDDQYHEKPFDGFQYSMLDKLRKEVLINNLQDQERTLAAVKKYVRKRGKIEYLRNGNGHFVRDEHGNRVPKVAQGDAVRGQLHKETFYGKIKIAAKDENGSLLRNEDHSIQYLKDDHGNDIFWMVGRKPIENINFKSDIIVDEYLAKHLKEQLDSGVEQNALKDYQGNVIRRVRCAVKSGRGVMNPDNVTVVKEQTYKSDKEYKNFYYTDSGDNYMFGLYEKEKGRKIVAINTLDATRYAIDQNEDSKRDIFKSVEPVMIGRGKNKEEGKLVHIFLPGQKVLFFLESKEELKELNREDLSKRLYFVKKLADANQQKIQFQHHLEARTDEQLGIAFPRSQFGTKGKDGFSSFMTDFIVPRLLLTPSNYNFIIENKDFIMDFDGSVSFNF